MTRQDNAPDSHAKWLIDSEYRHGFGSETAKLEMADALLRGREGMSLTQSRLANLAGTSQAYIAKLERGDANPTIGNVGRLFACMWLKPRIEPALLDPSKSIESAVLETLGASETRLDPSRFKERPGPGEIFPDIITRPTCEVFKDLVDKGLLISVWHYDTTARTWSSYFPDAPEGLNDLLMVSTGDPVWMQTSENVDFQGEPYLAGWNFLSLK